MRLTGASAGYLPTSEGEMFDQRVRAKGDNERDDLVTPRLILALLCLASVAVWVVVIVGAWTVLAG